MKKQGKLKFETIIQIKKENLDLQIQINELRNKILKNQRKLLKFEVTCGEKSEFFDDLPLKDYPE